MQKLRTVTVNIPPLCALVPAIFLVTGIVLGFVFSGRCEAQSAAELREFYDGWLAASGGHHAQTAETVFQTLICFLRTPVTVFLLGFASVGVFLIPLVFAVQGFVLSFSVFSFAGAVGRGSFALLFALFGLRMLFVLPATFFLGTAALEQSVMLTSFLGGKRTRPVYGLACWYRFAVCFALLLLGSGLELWLLPLLLTG